MYFVQSLLASCKIFILTPQKKEGEVLVVVVLKRLSHQRLLFHDKISVHAYIVHGVANNRSGDHKLQDRTKGSSRYLSAFGTHKTGVHGLVGGGANQRRKSSHHRSHFIRFVLITRLNEGNKT